MFIEQPLKVALNSSQFCAENQAGGLTTRQFLVSLLERERDGPQFQTKPYHSLANTRDPSTGAFVSPLCGDRRNDPQVYDATVSGTSPTRRRVLTELAVSRKKIETESSLCGNLSSNRIR